MRNRPRLIAPILGMGLSALLTGCGWSSGETTLEGAEEGKAPHSAMATAHEMKSQKPALSVMAKGASTEVVIDNFTFDPPQLTISPGTAEIRLQPCLVVSIAGVSGSEERNPVSQTAIAFWVLGF